MAGTVTAAVVFGAFQIVAGDGLVTSIVTAVAFGLLWAAFMAFWMRRRQLR